MQQSNVARHSADMAPCLGVLKRAVSLYACMYVAQHIGMLSDIFLARILL